MSGFCTPACGLSTSSKLATLPSHRPLRSDKSLHPCPDGLSSAHLRSPPTASLLCLIAIAAAAEVFDPATRTFYFGTAELRAQAAESWCQEGGGHLCSILSAAEQAHVSGVRQQRTYGPYNDGNSMWIGIRRNTGGSPFYWIDGSPMSYTNFDYGETSGSETETAMWRGGKWDTWGTRSSSFTHTSCCVKLTCPSTAFQRMDGKCQRLAECTAEQVEITAPTTTSDRVCETIVTTSTTTTSTTVSEQRTLCQSIDVCKGTQRNSFSRHRLGCSNVFAVN